MSKDTMPPALQDAMRPATGVVKKKAAKKPSAAPPLPRSCTIEVPLGDLDEGYLNRHVEIRLQTRLQQETMRRLLNGLRAAGEKLADGKVVQSNADAIKWVLERMAAGLG